MNKNEYIKAVAERTSTSTKEASNVVNAALDIIGEQLAAGESLEFTGFGKFYVKERAEREGKNPQTGEPITIAAAKVPAFKPGEALKDLIH